MQLALAEVTAIRRIRGILFARHLFGRDHSMRDVVSKGKCRRCLKLFSWRRRRVGSDCEHLFAKHSMSKIGNVSTVGSSREGNQRRSERTEEFFEGPFLMISLRA